MDLGISNHDSCSCGVLDRKLCLSLLTTNTSDTSAQVIAVQSLHVLDLKSLKVQVIKSENCDCVLQIKAKHEAFQKVSTFLNRTNVLCVLGCLSILKYHSQLKVTNN